MEKSITSPKYLRLLKWLKKSRLERDMTIRALSEKLGQPSSFVTKVEQAERRLDVLEFVVYCEALGIDPRDGLNIISSK